MIGILSRAILRIPRLETLLGEPSVHVSRWRTRQASLSAIAGWGLKPTSRQARNYARRHDLPYLALEDGFIRSVGLGNQDPPLSLIIDDLGVYYDATRPSRLEAFIRRPLSDAALRRARNVREAWCAERVSKYNRAREKRLPLPSPAVLLVDQTYGDPAITYGLANPKQFERLLDAALDENPDATIVIKIHPDVLAGRKRGHFDPRQLARLKRVRLLAHDVHPVSLLEQVQAVYTVTSQMGFEALLWGRRVRVFGMPFYAGWGLTEDELAPPPRRKPVGLESLIHGALIDAPRYLDPETGKLCEVERLLDWMGLQRRMRERFPESIQALGFSAWKRPLVRRFMQGSQVEFKSNENGLQSSDARPLVVWGLTPAPEGRAVLRLEDGFLRSVGLGADLVAPLSWVIDQHGLYYDPSQPSDLEILLETHEFDEMLLERAQRLRKQIVASGLTKYNVGLPEWQRPLSSKRVILVPGQVETDASIRRGAPGIRRNLELLRVVREANPQAYVIYKPHPDVVAGLRARGAHESSARYWCDEIVIDIQMATLLESVDEVHVLTSLAGFEALLRGKRVVCHGQPFYAGWGLTEDRLPLERRRRTLSLEMLVAGTLLLYPTYVSRVTRYFTTPEQALEELIEWRERGEKPTWWYRMFARPALGKIAAWRDQQLI